MPLEIRLSQRDVFDLPQRPQITKRDYKEIFDGNFSIQFAVDSVCKIRICVQGNFDAVAIQAPGLMPATAEVLECVFDPARGLINAIV